MLPTISLEFWYLPMALQPFIGPLPLFKDSEQYRQSVGPLERGMSPSQGRCLHTEQRKQKKRTQTAMTLSGIGTHDPAFERAKTVHALDCAAVVMD
jgi:hypothetical protein